jgi:hypothetical protein
VGTVMQETQRGNEDRHQRWDRIERADLFARYDALQTQGVSQRQAAKTLRNHELRGLDHPRKRVCLTAVHNFLLTRADGTTAAERFFGQKPRSMLTAILESVELPPAPLSPPRRAGN